MKRVRGIKPQAAEAEAEPEETNRQILTELQRIRKALEK